MNIDRIDKWERSDSPDGVLKLDYRSSVDEMPDWALVSPPKDGDTWVVCIHGHGSFGDQLYTRPDLREEWLPHFIDRGVGMLTPNLRGNAWMGPAAVVDMSEMLTYARREFGARRFIFASGSMGGTSNLIYASMRPADVSAVIALGTATDLSSYHAWCRKINTDILREIADAIEASYGGLPGDNRETYFLHSVIANAGSLSMPVFISHGNIDDIITVAQPRSLAAAMGDAANLVYVEVPDGDHNSPIFNMSKAFDWALGKI